MIKDGDLFAAGGDLPLPVLAVCNGETQSPLSLRNPPPPEDPADRRMLGALPCIIEIGSLRRWWH